MLGRAASGVGRGVAKVFDRKTMTVAVVLVISLAVLFSVIDNVRARRQAETRDSATQSTNRQLVQLAGQATAEAKKNGQQIAALQQQVADQNRQIAALRKQLTDAGVTPGSTPGPSPASKTGSSGSGPRTGGPGGAPGHPRPSASPTSPPQPPPDEGPGGVVGVVCSVPLVHDLLC